MKYVLYPVFKTMLNVAITYEYCFYRFTHVDVLYTYLIEAGAGAGAK
jgi:hypothetical protein